MRAATRALVLLEELKWLMLLGGALLRAFETPIQRPPGLTIELLGKEGFWPLTGSGGRGET